MKLITGSLRYQQIKKLPTKNLQAKSKQCAMSKSILINFWSTPQPAIDRKKSFLCLVVCLFSFASIVTCPHVTDFWAQPNLMFQEKSSSSEAKRNFSWKSIREICAHIRGQPSSTGRFAWVQITDVWRHISVNLPHLCHMLATTFPHVAVGLPSRNRRFDGK